MLVVKRQELFESVFQYRSYCVFVGILNIQNTLEMFNKYLRS